MPRMKPTSPAAGKPGAGATPTPSATRRPQLRAGDAMQRAALAVSTVEGEGVFRGLVESLAQILGTDLAFIALPEPGDPPRMRMLAFRPATTGDMPRDAAPIPASAPIRAPQPVASPEVSAPAARAARRSGAGDLRGSDDWATVTDSLPLEAAAPQLAKPTALAPILVGA